MTRFLSLATLVFLLAMPAQAPAQTKWDLTNEYGFNSFIGVGNQEFADVLKARSGGEVLVTPHFGGALGFKSKDVLDVVGRGAVPMGDAAVGFWIGIDPIFQLSLLPFLVSDTQEAFALYQIAKPYYSRVLLKNNQYLLYSVPWPPNGIWSKKPIESASSFNGLKIRTLDPASTNVFRALKAIPQQLAWADVVPMLATGGIEAVLTSADGGASAKFWDHVQNFSAINFAWALSMLTVNKDAFDKLSDKNKKAVRDAASEVEARRWAALDENVQSRYAEMRTKNVKVLPAISAETRASMVKASEPAVNEWLGKIGPDGKAIIDSFRNRPARK